MVVVNHYKRYSIWPVDRGLPNGWRDTGKRAAKQQYLEYIKEACTDMPPFLCADPENCRANQIIFNYRIRNKPRSAPGAVSMEKGTKV